MKEALILVRSAPYGEASAAEGFRVVITLPAMDIPTTVVAMEDGVFCLLRGGDGARLEWRSSLWEAFSQLGQYDARLLVHGPSARQRGIGESELIRNDGWVDEEGLRQLIGRAAVVLAF
ncbi:MAG: DsrE family protein [Thermodesulfobacteriota bacterium]